MSNNKLVSVIIPLFNSENTIKETIESVLNQTYCNIEIIVVNDGSTDSSSSIVQRLNNPKIKLINISNSGASKARNIGINNANGIYIQFLDADDILSSNKIEHQVKILESNDVDVCFCRTVVFTNLSNLSTNHEINTEIFNFVKINGNDLLKKLMGINTKVYMILPSAYLLKKRILDTAGEWDESLSLDDDGEFFSRVLNCSKVVVFDKNGINYYRRFHTQNSLSQQTGKKYIVSEINSVLKKLTTIKKDISLIEYNKIKQVQLSLIKYKYYKILKKIDFIDIDNELKLVGGFEIKILPTFKGRLLMSLLGSKLYFFLLNCIR